MKLRILRESHPRNFDTLNTYIVQKKILWWWITVAKTETEKNARQIFDQIKHKNTFKKPEPKVTVIYEDQTD